jgi:low temperature requirement protein LtrA
MDRMATNQTETTPSIRSWFRGPPRAHGEVLDDRVVSFLELFYDLVFVVLIAQISHTLAGDVSWIGIRNFAIVFALIWIAWVNGTFYHELHGRDDGRNRSYIFVQMTMLVLLAVYAAHAADDTSDGRGFAIVYALLLSFIAWQWLGLRKHDTAEMAALTLRYVIGMSVPIGLVAISAIIDNPDTRLILWTAAIAVTIAGLVAQIFRSDEALEDAFRVTESMAERFGLFTIIVLGEVVVGVVDGLSESSRSGRTIATGIVALVIGFGFWWNYFDFVGRRAPRRGALTRGLWNLGHLPMWLSVAAAGAGMVSLVEHANDNRTPAATAWLVASSTAAIALSLALIAWTMPTQPGRRMVPYTLTAAAAIAILLGALRPSPIILAATLAATLSLVWFEALARHLRTGSAIGAD